MNEPSKETVEAMALAEYVKPALDALTEADIKFCRMFAPEHKFHEELGKRIKAALARYPQTKE